MKPLWRTALLITCVAVILLIGYQGTLVPLPAFAQAKKSSDQKTEESINELRQSAEQGNAEAQFNLAQMYNFGRGVSQDYAEALRWYHKSAGQGDAKAEWVLGFKYDRGQGVPPDYAKALRWYLKAAKQGYAEAQDCLGTLYAEGHGVPQNYGEALQWYRKAAEQGFGGAQHNVGLMYERGQGVPQNYVQAYMWLSVWASNGRLWNVDAPLNRSALAMLGQLAPKMTPEQITEAQRLAKEWKPKNEGW